MIAGNDSGGGSVTRRWKTGFLVGVALLGCFSAEAALLVATAAQMAKLPPRANGFLTITPLEAKALLEARSEVVIIDVRSLEEFREGALPDSVLVPFFDAMSGKILLPKDTPLLLVCAVGGRSMAVGRYLAMQGFQEVYNLKGGLDAWLEQRVPFPSRKKAG